MEKKIKEAYIIKISNKYCLDGIQAMALNVFTMEERKVNVN